MQTGASVGWRLYFSSIDDNRPDYARARPNTADGGCLVVARTDYNHGTALGVERPETQLRRCQLAAR
jgi:hypothetical protein